uniref:Uncharacterized protein n=1 Tax=Chromera velia CCMP2878 TaxID=1169474 RepID=A0A0G4I3C8_9ALVE|eukprot:Cvel_10639.t1-p1 / transcript=Cvel_10639.t1 / gene=Cvel_10639 / organism=Chromera_velia_CCMP2878 / gene_product=hypothetical protein / transcript_product=hypothetical protein / location=Cvel_scaffold646:32118-35896(+) / protein_length=974 / sequence_SO=supercontig / SO=protein_coding / is_pseudo=false
MHQSRVYPVHAVPLVNVAQHPWTLMDKREDSKKPVAHGVRGGLHRSGHKRVISCPVQHEKKSRDLTKAQMQPVPDAYVQWLAEEMRDPKKKERFEKIVDAVRRRFLVKLSKKLFVDFSENVVGYLGEGKWLAQRPHIPMAMERADDDDMKRHEKLLKLSPQDKHVDPLGFKARKDKREAEQKQQKGNNLAPAPPMHFPPHMPPPWAYGQPRQAYRTNIFTGSAQPYGCLAPLAPHPWQPSPVHTPNRSPRAASPVNLEGKAFPSLMSPTGDRSNMWGPRVRVNGKNCVEGSASPPPSLAKEDFDPKIQKEEKRKIGERIASSRKKLPTVTEEPSAKATPVQKPKSGKSSPTQPKVLTRKSTLHKSSASSKVLEPPQQPTVLREISISPLSSISGKGEDQGPEREQQKETAKKETQKRETLKKETDRPNTLGLKSKSDPLPPSPRIYLEGDLSLAVRSGSSKSPSGRRFSGSSTTTKRKTVWKDGKLSIVPDTGGDSREQILPSRSDSLTFHMNEGNDNVTKQAKKRSSEDLTKAPGSPPLPKPKHAATSPSAKRTSLPQSPTRHTASPSKATKAPAQKTAKAEPPKSPGAPNTSADPPNGAPPAAASPNKKENDGLSSPRKGGSPNRAAARGSLPSSAAASTSPDQKQTRQQPNVKPPPRKDANPQGKAAVRPLLAGRRSSLKLSSSKEDPQNNSQAVDKSTAALRKKGSITLMKAGSSTFSMELLEGGGDRDAKAKIPPGGRSSITSQAPKQQKAKKAAAAGKPTVKVPPLSLKAIRKVSAETQQPGATSQQKAPVEAPQAPVKEGVQFDTTTVKQPQEQVQQPQVVPLSSRLPPAQTAQSPIPNVRTQPQVFLPTSSHVMSYATQSGTYPSPAHAAAYAYAQQQALYHKELAAWHAAAAAASNGMSPRGRVQPMQQMSPRRAQPPLDASPRRLPQQGPAPQAVYGASPRHVYPQAAVAWGPGAAYQPGWFHH